jgi:hypothetical protein
VALISLQHPQLCLSQVHISDVINSTSIIIIVDFSGNAVSEMYASLSHKHNLLWLLFLMCMVDPTVEEQGTRPGTFISHQAPLCHSESRVGGPRRLSCMHGTTSMHQHSSQRRMNSFSLCDPTNNFVSQ